MNFSKVVCVFVLFVIGLFVHSGCGGSAETVDVYIGVGYADGAYSPDTADTDKDDGPPMVGSCSGLNAYDPCDSDNNNCTVEYCEPDTGECTIKRTTVCDDKMCLQSTCEPQTGQCVYEKVQVGTKCMNPCFTTGFVCDDQAFCVSGEYICADGTESCEIVPIEPVKVDCGGQLNESGCIDHYECNPDDNGQCTRVIYKENGASCDLDSNVCTLDACLPSGDGAMVCSETGEFNTCEEKNKNNPCFTWTCNGKAGCVQTTFVAGVSCEDGNACTVNDVCVEGEGGFGNGCKGTPKPTDDNNPCTDDQCVEGSVLHSPLSDVPCEDGKICTKSSCVEGECAATGQLDCDDGNVCTDDICDPFSGCVFIPNTSPCDDGSACTEKDICGQFQCKGKPIVCEDENPCNGRETCVDTQGCVLIEAAPNCDDANLCTDDVCNPQFKTSELENLHDACGNAFNTLPCDDQSSCTEGDLCSAGICKGTDIKCDNGDLCDGVYTCDKGVGCVTVIGPVTCSDNNTCTDDFCDPQSGCVFIPNTQPCEDGSLCTLDDSCKNGVCKSGQPPQCDDDNVCNGLESCKNDSGCKSGTPLICNDNDKCSGEETCDSVTGCKPGTSLICDDGNVCNGVFTCKPATGCAQTVAPLICDDKSTCTDDSCHPTTGCAHTDHLGACNDGNECTLQDTCVAGACKPTNSVVCNDGNVCTVDSCVTTTGACKSTPVLNAACDDGDECTLVDSCTLAGSCVGVGAKKCAADNDPCTADVCVPFYGCDYPKLTCNDSEECTLDYCSGGAGGGGCYHVNKDNGTPCGPASANVCQTGKCTKPN